jgi:hypothetical protein
LDCWPTTQAAAKAAPKSTREKGVLEDFTMGWFMTRSLRQPLRSGLLNFTAEFERTPPAFLRQ